MMKMKRNHMMDGNGSSSSSCCRTSVVALPDDGCRPSKRRRRKSRRRSPSPPIPIPSFFVKKINSNTLKITAVSSSASTASAVTSTTTNTSAKTVFTKGKQQEEAPRVSNKSCFETLKASSNNMENLHPPSSSKKQQKQQPSKLLPASSFAATTKSSALEQQQQEEEVDEEDEDYPCTQPPPPLQASTQSRSSSSNHHHHANARKRPVPVILKTGASTVAPSSSSSSSSRPRAVSQSTPSKSQEMQQKSVAATTATKETSVFTIHHDTPLKIKQQQKQKIMAAAAQTTTSSSSCRNVQRNVNFTASTGESKESNNNDGKDNDEKNHHSNNKQAEEQMETLSAFAVSTAAIATATNSTASSSSSSSSSIDPDPLFVENPKNDKKQRCAVLVDQSSAKRNINNNNNNNITCGSEIDQNHQQQQPVKKRPLEKTTLLSTLSTTTLDPPSTCTHPNTTTTIPSRLSENNKTTRGRGVLCAPTSRSVHQRIIITTADPSQARGKRNDKKNTSNNTMERKTVTFASNNSGRPPPRDEEAKNANQEQEESSLSSSATALVSSAPAPPPSRHFVLYFVPSGRDMTPPSHLEWPKQHAKNRGATVLEEFDHRLYERQQHQQQLVMPTHFVVSDSLSHGDPEGGERMAQACSFASLQEMAEFCHQNGIVCATKAWATAAAAPPPPPPLNNDNSSSNNVNDVVDCFYREPILKKEVSAFSPREVYILPQPKSLHWTTTTSTTTIASATEPVVVVGNRNKALSDLFLRISKLLQSAPWNGMEDTWKSYSFNNIAGRLRSLDFEVIVGGTISPANMKKLKAVHGIGASTLAIIQEYVEKLDDDDFKGSPAAQEIERIQYLQHDENRVAMRAMMNIHGVGPVKARQLVEAGYKTIQQLRQDVYDEGRQKRVSLNRNQYVGLLCYEDLLERMPASEVEAIAATVKQVVHRRFPSAEITVMGSFRRKQRDTFGDVDILITHPDYPNSVPSKALGYIVDELKARNKIAHHLTLISGMDPTAYDQDLDKSVLERLEAHTNRKAKKDKSSCSTYMGIFKSDGKLRRVDMKFYPYRERVFASLYFTGNGYFNRSMRLWARREGMQLNDHGLFSREGQVPIMDNPSTEKQVFEMLGLVHKEPYERDGFHAVVGAKKKLTALQIEGELELDKKLMKEFREEEQEHTWIN